MAGSQTHSTTSTELGIENLYGEDGTTHACPQCELAVVRAAVSDARERWSEIFQENREMPARTVREALATALHYMEIACECGGHTDPDHF